MKFAWLGLFLVAGCASEVVAFGDDVATGQSAAEVFTCTDEALAFCKPTTGATIPSDVTGSGCVVRWPAAGACVLVTVDAVPSAAERAVQTAVAEFGALECGLPCLRAVGVDTTEVTLGARRIHVAVDAAPERHSAAVFCEETGMLMGATSGIDGELTVAAALHAIGHGFGLRHAGLVSESIMSANNSSAVLTESDRAALCALYADGF